jgi:hypothetical protein
MPLAGLYWTPPSSAVGTELYSPLGESWTTGKNTSSTLVHTGIEKRYVHRDGYLIWANETAFSVKDASGHQMYSVVTVPFKIDIWH